MLDFRYALHMMRRSPGFTAVAVLSLALGIGANTAIFSLIDTLMLRMLPVQDPGRLVEILFKAPGQDHMNAFSWQSYEHYRDNNHVFSGVVASTNGSFYVRAGRAQPESVDGVYATPNYFSVLGVKAAIGRLEGDGIVAVVSWAYWKSRFNLDPAIVGMQITVDDRPATIIGVTDREFTGIQPGSKRDIWLPLALHPAMRNLTARYWLQLAARLKPGVSIEQARAEMAVLWGWTIEDEFKVHNDASVRAWRAEVLPAGAGLSILRDQFGKPLVLLMAVVGLLLAIACTNVASMLLARGAARQREMAVRASLGASRLRLLRQTLTESVLLSVAGGALGIFLAYFGTAALVRIIASGRLRIDLQVQPDARSLWFTVAIALLTGVLFGLAPAFRALGAAPASFLRDAGKGGETRLRKLFGKSLVVAQVAFSIVLLSAAALFVRHLSNLRHLDLGFRRDNVLLVTLDPSHSGYDRARLARAYQGLLDRLETIPGVRSTAISALPPIAGGGAMRPANVEGYQAAPGERRFISENWVTPKYFETLGIPLLAGRDFSLQDLGGPRVGIINQTMAHYFFGSGNPIGKHVIFDGSDQSYEIVGVVADAKYAEVHEAAARMFYFNMFQDGRVFSWFALRTSVEPAAVTAAVRRTILSELKTVPVDKVTTVTDRIDASIVPERLVAMLSGLFGALGALLAALGLYGLLAYTVTRRINEIGIRMALGATQRDVTRMVLVDALVVVCGGLAVGGPIAYWGKGFAANLIKDLPATSVMPIVFGVVVMMVGALAAAYLPARRAARVDPMVALRWE